MQTYISQHKNTFLPYMCEATLEFFIGTMIKTDFHDSLFKLEPKSVFNDKESSHSSSIDINMMHKSKFETDHSSSTSKEVSRLSSPLREETLSGKIQNLNMSTGDFSSQLWRFISERYVPYLDLLNT